MNPAETSRVQELFSPSERTFTPEFWFAAGATVLLNLLLLAFAPGLLLEPDSDYAPSIPEAEAVELALLLEESQEEEEPSQYVETAPDTPENIPDDTRNFSNRNTQAANPEAERRSEDRTPRLEGQADVGPALDPNNQGQRALPDIPRAQAPQQAQQPQPPIQPQTPPPMPLAQAPDFLEAEAQQDEGLASSLAESGEGEETQERYGDSPRIPLTATPSPLTEENSQSEERTEQQQQAVQAQEPSPRPRPRVDPRSISGLVRQSLGGVPGTGQLSWDAKMTPFGEYLALMAEPIKNKWHSLARASVQNESGTRVRVKFTLHKDGSVSDVEIAESNAKSLTAAVICKDAIENPSPFREWPPEMVARFGDEETFEFGFWYF